jgi:hypothetical protein
VPLNVTINLVSNTFYLTTNILQLVHDVGVIVVVLLSKLVDDRDDDRERSRDERDND